MGRFLIVVPPLVADVLSRVSLTNSLYMPSGSGPQPNARTSPHSAAAW